MIGWLKKFVIVVPEAASAPDSVADSQMDDDDENQSDNADDSIAGPSSRRSGLRKSRSSLTKAKAASKFNVKRLIFFFLFLVCLSFFSISSSLLVDQIF